MTLSVHRKSVRPDAPSSLTTARASLRLAPPASVAASAALAQVRQWSGLRAPLARARDIKAGLPPAWHLLGIPPKLVPSRTHTAMPGTTTLHPGQTPARATLFAQSSKTHCMRFRRLAPETRAQSGRLVAHLPRIAQPLDLASVDAGAGYLDRTGVSGLEGHSLTTRTSPRICCPVAFPGPLCR